MILGPALALLLCIPGVSRQAPDLAPVAELARQALASHDAALLLGASTRVLLQLPGAAPSAPVGRAHSKALLDSYLDDFEEVTTEVRSVSLAGEKAGTVELRRSYRVPGTSGVRIQSVLLAYQLIQGRWVLAELRITG
ncbi:MAG: hypothetical protein ABJC74_13020 [Gemmatimonadota bacterium]